VELGLGSQLRTDRKMDGLTPYRDCNLTNLKKDNWILLDNV